MLRVLDLFSGIGGFSLGLERTGGFQTVAFCEIEPFCRSVLAKHWPGVPIYEDVKILTTERLGSDGITVDVICGGFPCQDISVAGKGAGLDGERSGLWFEFHRLIKEIKPQYAIIENVSALRSRGLDAVLRSLAEIGYDAVWHCIPASAVGAPHQRDRIWIVAYAASGGWREGCVRDERNNGQSFGERRSIISTQSSETSALVADSECVECGKRHQFAEKQRWSNETQQIRLGGSGIIGTNPDIAKWWEVEPDVGRVAHGVSNRAHRLRALGNAVVPQIPEIIGRAILDAFAH
jgi:DNA (cytosine-5)-methyltransferase 1